MRKNSADVAENNSNSSFSHFHAITENPLLKRAQIKARSNKMFFRLREQSQLKLKSI